MRQALIEKDYDAALSMATPESFVLYEDGSSPLSMVCDVGRIDLIEKILDLIPENKFRQLIYKVINSSKNDEIVQLLRHKARRFNLLFCRHCDDRIGAYQGHDRRYCVGCCCDRCLNG